MNLDDDELPNRCRKFQRSRVSTETIVVRGAAFLLSTIVSRETAWRIDDRIRLSAEVTSEPAYRPTRNQPG
jgi:hypothetical protein